MGFPNVKELRIGGVTKAELQHRLSDQGVSMNDYARTLFADPDFVTSDEERNVVVVQISLPGIGLPEGGTFAEILARAAQAGLAPCPLEVAPHLRLHYPDQPEGPYLTVASLELHPGTLQPNGFYLRRLDGQLWLRGYESGPENTYAPDFTDFVFIDPDRS